MKVSKRDLGLLLGLVGLVAVFFAYQFVYTPNMDKKEQLERQLTSLKTRESELANLEANMSHYKTEIMRMNNENAEVITHFPADILPENEIMYAVDLEENAEIYYTSLNYGTPSLISTGKEERTGVNAYLLNMTMSYQSTYAGLKKAILYNIAQNERMVFDSVSAVYDHSTGNLNGTLGLNMYFMTGTENVYSEPYVPSMKIGTKNIFGTYENTRN